MKKSILFALMLSVPAVAPASGGHGAHLDHAKVNIHDQASLQRGARLFVNYCLSCHSASYMRYNRMAEDLGIPENLLIENMMFIPDVNGNLKPGSLMKATMPKDVAKAAFNTVPPDLSLTARSRGADWIYTYMRSFYRDDKAVSGWNNIVFPSVAMPHVLHDLQGTQRAVYRTETREYVATENGKKVKKTKEETVFDRFELDRAGSMSREEFDAAMGDLTNFMVYLSEPAKLVRYNLGLVVLVFLFIFMVLVWLLNKEYWKDVH